MNSREVLLEFFSNDDAGLVSEDEENDHIEFQSDPEEDDGEDIHNILSPERDINSSNNSTTIEPTLLVLNEQ